MLTSGIRDDSGTEIYPIDEQKTRASKPLPFSFDLPNAERWPNPSDVNFLQPSISNQSIQNAFADISKVKYLSILKNEKWFVPFQASGYESPFPSLQSSDILPALQLLLSEIFRHGRLI